MPDPIARIHANAKYILRWLLITTPVAVVVGSLNAMFLWLLAIATDTLIAHSWLLYLLPFAGLLIVLSYRVAGKNAEAGNGVAGCGTGRCCTPA